MSIMKIIGRRKYPTPDSQEKALKSFTPTTPDRSSEARIESTARTKKVIARMLCLVPCLRLSKGFEGREIIGLFFLFLLIITCPGEIFISKILTGLRQL